MPIEVILPKVDMDMTHAKIEQWHVDEGQLVKQGDILFDMETDKSMMEVEAPASGVLTGISPLTDQALPVGEVVAWIHPEGEAVTAIPVIDTSLTTKNDVVENTSIVDTSGDNFDDPGEPLIGNHDSDAGNARRATPYARKLARDNDLELEAVTGSGPNGRIVSTDIERHLHKDKSAVVSPTDQFATNTESHFTPGTFKRVKQSSMRRAVANRVTRASSTIPVFDVTVDCEIDALLLARETYTKKNEERTDTEPALIHKPTINDYIIKALAVALNDVPAANATWTPDALLFHDQIDIGVAVALDDGLIIPLVRNANRKSLTEISLDVRRLAGKARDGTLQPAEYRGGTSTVSNLGMYGADRFTSIINDPQSSILSVGKGSQRAVVHDGILGIATVLTATFAFDHRVIDGAVGARLAEAFRHCIHYPAILSSLPKSEL